MAPFLVSLCIYLFKYLWQGEFIKMMYIKHLTQLLLYNTSPSVTLTTTHITPRSPSGALTSHFSSPGSDSTFLLASTTWFPSRILNETSPNLKSSSTQWHSFSSSVLRLSWYYHQLHCLDLEPNLLYLLTPSCLLISLMLKISPFSNLPYSQLSKDSFWSPVSWGMPWHWT